MPFYLNYVQFGLYPPLKIVLELTMYENILREAVTKIYSNRSVDQSTEPKGGGGGYKFD